uniref:Uncharacterized protein n=1 Tax=Triticum urartu TaxID=4572 RepID=A0A8R7PLY0_TRIUA
MMVIETWKETIKPYNHIEAGWANCRHLLVPTADPFMHHLIQRRRGGAPLAEALRRRLLQLRHLGPHLGALALPRHHLPHRRGDLLPPLRVRHPYRGADPLAQHHGVLPLLREEGPGDHRHAVHQALQHRVPPAVHQEASRGLVGQHLYLRGP